MNWYPELARNYFTQWLPQWYEQIDDPESYFAALGKELAHQADDFADELAGQARPGEGYLAPGGPADGSPGPGDRDRAAGTGLPPA
jgi:hypothetical protein